MMLEYDVRFIMRAIGQGPRRDPVFDAAAGHASWHLAMTPALQVARQLTKLPMPTLMAAIVQTPCGQRSRR